MKKKTFVLLLALVLIAGAAVGGTLAWLTAKSDAVVNTFTTSDITVKLKETTGTSYNMVPGCELEKNPKAWVVAGSEDCYLFVKLDWANNTYTSGKTTKNYLDWDIAEGWTLDPDETNVYYRIVTSTQMSSDDGKTNAYPVLAGNTVTVSGEITKEQMNAFTGDNLPKLTITAYATQYMSGNETHFEPADAWAKVNPTTTP